MNYLSEIYKKGRSIAGESPKWSQDWRWVVGGMIAIFIVNLLFRCSFADKWDNATLWVAGERILATHDAYYWLARAKWPELGGVQPLSIATAWFHGVTGVGFSDIAFWAPAVLAPLVAVVCFLWGWLLTGLRGAFFAGLVGGLTPGFYYRSRLGYFDTDLFTLVGPLFTAWLLTYWIIKKTSFTSSTAEGRDAPNYNGALLMLCAGLAARFCGWWHHDIAFLNVGFAFLAGVLVLLLGTKKSYASSLFELSIFILAAFPGLAGGQFNNNFFGLIAESTGFPNSFMNGVLAIAFAVALTVAVCVSRKRNSKIVSNVWVGFFLLGLIVFFVNLLGSPINALLGKLPTYLKSSEGTGGAVTTLQHVVYPAVLQSILEAKNVNIAGLLSRSLYWSWLGGIACLSTIIVTALRPQAVLLTVFVILGCSGIVLGNRFTMFGGAAMSVFVGVAISWAFAAVVPSRFSTRIVRVAAQAVLGLVVLVSIYGNYKRIPVTPVVDKSHAEALQALEKSSKNGVIWTWWDWGYATQYFTGLETTVDGGQHSGRYLYPVALALTSESLQQANQMIRYSSGYPPVYPATIGYSPDAKWDTMPADVVKRKVDSLAVESESFAKTSPQYFVVTWKDITLSKWISYFGNWDLATGDTRQTEIRIFKAGELGVNLQRGAVMDRRGGGGLVSDVDLLENGLVRSNHYGMNAISPKLIPKTPYLLLNGVTKQSVMLDESGYNSTMTRLLIGDPESPEISKYFKLVVDKLPFVRIYEVVQN